MPTKYFGRALGAAALLIFGCSDPAESPQAEKAAMPAAAPAASAEPAAAPQPAPMAPATDPAAGTAAAPAAPGGPRPLAEFQATAEQFKVHFDVPEWEKTPEEMTAAVDAALETANKALDGVAALPRDGLNLKNTVAALDDILYEPSKVYNRVGLIEQTHPDKAFREAATVQNKRLAQWFTEVGFREDIYQVVKAYADNNPQLSGEDAKLLSDTMRDYRRRGLNLDADKRKQLETLQTELNNLEIEFGNNINAASAPVKYTAAQLEGVPAAFLVKVKTGDDEYTVDGNITWHFTTVMENARNEETRKTLKLARYRRAREANLALFSQLLDRRARIANLAGYDSWADFRIEPKMAKNGRTAQAFLEKLRDGLEPKYQAELEVLRQIKAEETGKPDAKLALWDIRYLKNQLKKTRYNIDTEQLRVFFEYHRTLQGMFDVFEKLFQLKIEQVQAPYVWADGVTLYAISDSGTGEPLGLLYLDMFPREGKYGHFAQFGVTPGKQLEDGSYQRPVVALICNFPEPSDKEPSLLTHSHTETLFHEFGHALHSILTRARYATFSGTSVPRDFVEAPSQMLENWVWDKSVLDGFAVDYRDPKKKIPQEILDKMEEARLATIGTHYRRQLSFGILDLALHGTKDVSQFKDLEKVSNELLSRTYVPVPDDSSMLASFGHLGGGYDAGYYGYAWADAIAADMAAVFKKSPGGLMDTTIGRRLRDEIYAPGGSREITDSIAAFLGRERSLDPFLESIGIEQ
ncbi:MAG: Zn-dependent oligopeptidase [Gammaproteobacteria bacterium]|nr:Zn-dependent oligopeptidase [Gammaproteobacteria bacterium]